MYGLVNILFLKKELTYDIVYQNMRIFAYKSRFPFRAFLMVYIGIQSKVYPMV